MSSNLELYVMVLTLTYSLHCDCNLVVSLTLTFMVLGYGNVNLILTFVQPGDCNVNLILTLLLLGDGNVSPDEFVDGWTTKFSIGNTDQAQTLFTRADTNDDGYIDPQDIPGIFAFFDENGECWCGL